LGGIYKYYFFFKNILGPTENIRLGAHV